MPHEPEQVFLIAALVTVGLVIVVPVIIYLVHKLFFFDWPPLYEWQQARRQLRRIDQGRVIWATYYRHHPASRAALGGAQLACARYRQAAAQRALDRQRRGRRIGAVVFLGATAAGFAALAAVQSQQRITDIVIAVGYASNALGTLLAGPRSWRRQTERMTRLQAAIEDCCARRPDAAPPQRQERGLPHSA